jgi:hypothetical protein
MAYDLVIFDSGGAKRLSPIRLFREMAEIPPAATERGCAAPLG